MKILYIASVRIPNEKASGLAIMRQCEAFAKAGHEVDLLRPYRINAISGEAFTYYGIEPCFRVKTMHGFDIISLGKFGFFLMRLWQMLYTFAYVAVYSRNIDVIYTRDPWMAVLPTYVGFSKKIVLEVHKTYSSDLVDVAVKRAWKVVCITQGLKAHFVSKTERSDILVEPSGVNLTQFITVCSRKDARVIHGLPLDVTIIGYIGKYRTMGEEKGVNDLIEAFGHIVKTRKDVHLMLVGLEPEEQAEVHQIASRACISDSSITLLSLEQKDFASYVQASDVLVMNYPDTEHYRTYMSPTKLFAYMASGKCIVATDLPSVREVANEQMVYFSLPGNQASLVDVLLRTLNASKYEIRERGELCKKHVAEFSWDARGARILASLEGKVN